MRIAIDSDYPETSIHFFESKLDLFHTKYRSHSEGRNLIVHYMEGSNVAPLIERWCVSRSVKFRRFTENRTKHGPVSRPIAVRKMIVESDGLIVFQRSVPAKDGGNIITIAYRANKPVEIIPV